MHILSRTAIVAAFLLAPVSALADLPAALQAIERRDFEAAVRELSPLAKWGDPEAQYQLGTLYANGDGVPQNYDAAKTLFSAAASQGNGRARRALEFLADIGAIAPTTSRTELATGAAQAVAPPAVVGAAPATGMMVTPPAAGDLRLQLGTVLTEAGGTAEAHRVARRFQGQLGGVTVAAEPFQMSGGDIVYRVLTPPLAEAQAREICRQILAENGNCLPIKP